MRERISRRLRKSAKHILHEARYARHMRTDRAEAGKLDALHAAEGELREALAARQAAAVETKMKAVMRAIDAVLPPRSHSGIREHLEIVVVAFAVAFAFRTYFVQPFKIPTGSMQPTLYGITSGPVETRRWRDWPVVAVANYFVTGEWYREVKAPASGYIKYIGGRPQRQKAKFPFFSHVVSDLYEVAGQRVAIPSDFTRHFSPGDYVDKGRALGTGVLRSGDHIFVNRMKWNFSRPKRGEIMVFTTRGIEALDKDTYYIKRMAGVPGDELQIVPPQLRINGRQATAEPPHHEAFAKVENRPPGYQTVQSGYPGAALITGPDVVVELADKQYFALGDNTMSSLDSRYWGAVPEENLVGPAWCVFWPFSYRWGRAR